MPAESTRIMRIDMNSLIPKIDPVAVKVYYTNWRGQTRERHLFPLHIWYGCTAYHSTQWLISCLDLEDGKVKDFALTGFNGTTIYPDRIDKKEDDVPPEINVIDKIDRVLDDGGSKTGESEK